MVVDGCPICVMLPTSLSQGELWFSTWSMACMVESLSSRHDAAKLNGSAFADLPHTNKRYLMVIGCHPR